LTPTELNLCEQYNREIDEELQKLDVYGTKYQDKPVVATFSKLPVNEIAAYLLSEYKADVAIVVNTSTEFVSFRKSNSSPIDLRYMAENMCNGGGGQYAAGGKLTTKFMEFSQNLILL
jgi:oligoribonuclease NrnB/cAMP/cGMP phosphodiesterase (DHH superfamily)